MQQIDQLAISNRHERARALPRDQAAARRRRVQDLDLRNLLVTEPYFHDGSQETLWDTIDHYNKGGVQNPFLDGGITPLGPQRKAGIDDLVAFLRR